MNILKSIVKAAIDKRKALYLMVIIICILAGMKYQETTKSLLPDAKFPYVSVFTYMSGASPENMEGVTNLIEAELNDVSDLSLMTSTSSYGSSLVILKFNENSEIEDKISLVQNKMANIKQILPKKAQTPVVNEYDINDSAIIAIELDNRLPYHDKKVITSEIERGIKSISGVSKIKVDGLESRYIEVIPNGRLMASHGLSEIEIIDKIKSFQSTLPLGSMIIQDKTYGFQIKSQLESVEEIEGLVLRASGTQKLYIRDICEVSFVSKLDTSSYRIKDGKKEPIVTISVFKKKSGDTVAINNGVKSFVKTYNQSNDYGVKLSTALDVSTYISKSLNDVFNNALSGLLSVVVVLFFFIGLKEALVASSVIPVTLITSFLLFEFFSVTLNIFSIMGLIIALGMLVDNAIVVIEMIDEMKKDQDQLTIKEVVLKATSRVAPAILASTLTTVCALMPLALMKGDIGALIREIPLTAAIAMGISFITSISITPVLAVEFIKKESKVGFKVLTLIFITLCATFALSDNFTLTGLSFLSGALVMILAYLKLFTHKQVKVFDWFSHKITKLMHSKLQKAIVMSVTVLMLGISMMLLFSDFIEKEAMPEGDDIYHFASVNLVKGTTKKDTSVLAESINDYVLESGYVKKLNYSIGNSSINYMVELVSKDIRDMHSKDIISNFNRFITDIPGVSGGFSSDGQAGGLSLRLLSNNKVDLDKASALVIKTLEEMEGTLNPKVSFTYSQPTFDMTINKTRAMIYDVAPINIMLKMRYLTSGEEIISIDRSGEKTKVFLGYRNALKDLEDLDSIMIQDNRGRNVPLLEFVDIEEKRFENAINHYEGKNSVLIVSNKLKGYNTALMMKKLIWKIKDRLPTGVSYKVAGESEEMNKSFSDLGQKMVIASILVYIVLVLQFNSYSQPFAIILSIPYALIGVVLGYGVFGLTFSTLSFLGIVALVGIAVNDAIVLIDYINKLRGEGYTKIQSIIEGAKSRFNPIIATSLTTIAGVLPLALYNEDYSGVAYSLMFGLMFSTILTLVVVPITLNIIESLMHVINKGVCHE